MSDHVYKVVELVGSSQDSIEDAIRTAIKRAVSQEALEGIAAQAVQHPVWRHTSLARRQHAPGGPIEFVDRVCIWD